MSEGVPLYLAADGLTGRDGGPYLDQEERRIAEERRAVIEGREPDFDNPGSTAGTVLVNASQLVDTAPTNAPSKGGDGKTAADQAVVDALDVPVYATVPPEAYEETEPEPEPEPPPEEGESAENQPAGPPEEDPFAGTSATE